MVVHMGIISRNENYCNRRTKSIVPDFYYAMICHISEKNVREKKMDTKKLQQIIRIAKYYYELGWGQIDIANHEGISKSTVSRMLQKAFDLGYVKVTIDYPVQAVESLSEQLKEKFSLKEVFVTPVLVEDEAVIMNDTCRVLAEQLERYLSHDTVVGVSWGRTMSCLADHLQPMKVKNLKVVQLNGAISHRMSATGASKIVDSLARAGNGKGYILPVPVLVDSEEIANTMKQDSYVRSILDLAEAATVTIFSVGSIAKDSILYQEGFFTEEEYKYMLRSGAVGDICSRYFDIEGKIISREQDKRTMGISPESLKKKHDKIAIVTGTSKVRSILGALRGQFIDILYTDEMTARELLKLMED